LLELFLPGTVVSAENQGTFSDYHDAASGHVLTGEWWIYEHLAYAIYHCGIYDYGACSYSCYDFGTGSRLSKN
jgi:hypothetical protein